MAGAAQENRVSPWVTVLNGGPTKLRADWDQRAREESRTIGEKRYTREK